MEETEKRLDTYTQTIKDLEGEMKVLKKGQRELAYKLEDQESRDRRKNLRIQGLPEATQGENLTGKIQIIFLPSNRQRRSRGFKEKTAIKTITGTDAKS